MCLGRPLSANLPPLQHQLDVDQEEQQHEHPLRGDGDVADEGGDGQLQVRRVVESEEKEEIGGKCESKQIRICQSTNILQVSFKAAKTNTSDPEVKHTNIFLGHNFFGCASEYGHVT